MLKQISIVYEAKEEYDETQLLNDLKKFVFKKEYPIKLVGTHIKIIKDFHS